VEHVGSFFLENTWKFEIQFFFQKIEIQTSLKTETFEMTAQVIMRSGLLLSGRFAFLYSAGIIKSI
jgi:hypothetical protein